jgi:transcriptional regulator with XRE-family HTH domain
MYDGGMKDHQIPRTKSKPGSRSVAAAALKKWLRVRGVRSADLARRLAISRQRVAQYLRGSRVPKLLVASQIARLTMDVDAGRDVVRVEDWRRPARAL